MSKTNRITAITLDIGVGVTLVDAITTAQSAADTVAALLNKDGEPVNASFAFNGINMRVTQADVPAKLVRAYRRALFRQLPSAEA